MTDERFIQVVPIVMLAVSGGDYKHVTQYGKHIKLTRLEASEVAGMSLLSVNEHITKGWKSSGQKSERR